MQCEADSGFLGGFAAFGMTTRDGIRGVDMRTASVRPNSRDTLGYLRFLIFAFQGALEGLVQGGLGLFVFLLGDAALFVFDFEFEQLFL